MLFAALDVHCVGLVVQEALRATQGIVMPILQMCLPEPGDVKEGDRSRATSPMLLLPGSLGWKGEPSRARHCEHWPSWIWHLNSGWDPCSPAWRAGLLPADKVHHQCLFPPLTPVPLPHPAHLSLPSSNLHYWVPPSLTLPWWNLVIYILLCVWHCLLFPRDIFRISLCYNCAMKISSIVKWICGIHFWVFLVQTELVQASEKSPQNQVPIPITFKIKPNRM